MKTIRYADEAIQVPNTSIFLKTSENIVMNICNARIPEGFFLDYVDYQNTIALEKLYITWKYETTERCLIKLICVYMKDKKVLDTRIATDLWSWTADAECDKKVSVYNEHYEGQSAVVKALEIMPNKFDEMLHGVNRIVHGHMTKRANDDTEFMLEYNDFAAEFEPTLKKYGFSMDISPRRSHNLGDYYICIYDGDNYEDSNNSLCLATEEMDVDYSNGIFKDAAKKFDDLMFDDFAEMFESTKIIFDTAIRCRDCR